MIRLTNWPAVFSIALGAFALVTTEFLPIGMLSAIANGLNVTKGMAGLSTTLPGLCGAVAAPALILFSRTIDRRTILLFLAGIVCFSNVIVATASNLPMLLLGRALLGIGVGGFWSFALPIARRLAHETAGDRATSIVSAAIALSTIVSLPVGSILSEWLGWRTTFMVNGAFTLAVFVIQWSLLPSLPVEDRFSIGKLMGLFRIRQARFGFAITFFIVLGHFVAYTYVEPFLRIITHLTPHSVSYALLLYGIAGFFGTFLGEVTSTRFSVKWAFLAMILLIMAMTLFMGLFGGNSPSTFLFVGLWGLAFGAVPMCVNIWMYQSSPAAFEGGAAMLVTVFQISLASGSYFGGLLTDHTGLQTTYITAAVLSLIAAGILQCFHLKSVASS